MRTGRVLFAFALALALAVIPTATAGAAVTVGQTAPMSEEPFCAGFFENSDLVQTAVGNGPSYVVPAPGGVITSWSTMAGLDGGGTQEFNFEVLRPSALFAYTKIAIDSRPLTPGVLNTFPVQIPVQAGDVLGVELKGFFSEIGSDSPIQCGFDTTSKADELGFFEPALKIGETGEVKPEGVEFRLNASAAVLLPPTIASVNPPSGSVAGAAVTISGADFAKVSGVSFGGVPASFSVGSEGQIAATAPPSAALGEVPVMVTTVAGSTAVPASFTYEGCTVPKLHGKKLKAAKAGAKAADCKLGKVKKKKGATGKTGKVVGQKPKPGTLVAPGTAVKVTLGR